MRKPARIVTTVLVAATMFAGIVGEASAQVSHRALQHRYDGRYMSTAVAPTVSQAVPRDDDGANARNPALPSYQRGMGQETGGPARMLLP